MKRRDDFLSSNCFTLIEILVVTALIAILAGISLGVVGLATSRADKARTVSLIRQLETAIESYKAKYGFYIIDNNGVIYIDNFKGFLPDYEKFRRTFGKSDTGTPTHYWAVDSYDANLIYKSPGEVNRSSFDLASKGPDGKYGDDSTDEDDLGKGDDITNFTNNSN